MDEVRRAVKGGDAMDEFEMKSRLYGYIKEICHYSQMQVFATSHYQKNYFQRQIDEAVSGLVNLYMDCVRPPDRRTPPKMRASEISD